MCNFTHTEMLVLFSLATVGAVNTGLCTPMSQGQRERMAKVLTATKAYCDDNVDSMPGDDAVEAALNCFEKISLKIHTGAPS